MAVDKNGQIYATGLTFETDFPVTPNALEATIAGGGLYYQGFLAKLDATGSQILYATYLSGLRTQGLAVDDSGFIYVFADHEEQAPEDLVPDYPLSFPFPISPNAAQTQPAFPASSVVVKFAPSGELVYSTYVGGVTGSYSGNFIDTHVGAIAVDSRGAATVCGSTSGPDLPTDAASLQASPGGGWDAYILRVSPDGTAFEAATYLGGAEDEFCEDLQLAADGNVYAFGSTSSRAFPITAKAPETPPSPGGNLFVTSLDTGLSHIVWSTLVPGTTAQRMAFDPLGNVFVFGTMNIPTFPGPGVVSPWSCCTSTFFTAGFASSDKHLLSSQTLSEGFIFGKQMAVDNGGNVYFAAPSGPATLPDDTLNAATSADGALLARFNTGTQTLTYLGPVGGVGFDLIAGTLPIAYASNSDKLMLAGSVEGRGAGAFTTLDFSAERLPLVTQAGSAVWPTPSQVSPGDLVKVQGLGLGPTGAVPYDPSVGTPTLLAQTSVLFDGTPVPLVSVGSAFVLALAPASLTAGGVTNIAVQSDGVLSDARSVPVVAANPGLSTQGATGTGQADAENPDGTANSSQHPVGKGANIRLYATGLGEAGASGNLSALSATVGELNAPVVNIAPAAGRPPGYFQIDVTIPRGVPQSDSLLVQIQVNGTPTQPGVTLSVR